MVMKFNVPSKLKFNSIVPSAYLLLATGVLNSTQIKNPFLFKWNLDKVTRIPLFFIFSLDIISRQLAFSCTFFSTYAISLELLIKCVQLATKRDSSLSALKISTLFSREVKYEEARSLSKRVLLETF